MLVKNVEKKDTKTASFDVEVDAAEFEVAVNKAYLKNKPSISIPGFRQGKAPRSVVEGMYGSDVFYQDAIDALGPEAFGFGYDNCGLKIIGRPSVSNIDLSDEKILTITFAVELYPEVTLGQYKELSAPKQETEVTDEMVEQEFEQIVKRNSRMIDVDRPAEMGDTANIDFEGFLNGETFEGGKAEGYALELGSGSFVPGFEEQIVGMTVGEEKDIDITFPENYAEELAGKAVVFKIKLNALTAPELPVVDDEFIQDISQFNTIDEYKADIKEGLVENAKNQADSQFRSAIIAQACDNMTVEVPETMIAAKVDVMLRDYAANFGMETNEMSTEDILKTMGLDEETVNATIRPAAEAQVKMEILLDAVIEAEGIVCTDEDEEAYIAKVAESVNAKPEDIKSYFGSEFIRNEYLREKANDVLFGTATVSEAEAEEKAE